MRNIEDAFGKNILRGVLELRGSVETEAEVSPSHTKRIDVWYVPEVDKLELAPVFTDLLDEMTSEPSAVELWSNALSEDEFHVTYAKRENFRETLEQRGASLGTSSTFKVRPRLWHLCAGKPNTVIMQFGFVPLGMTGRYVLRDPGWRVMLVVVNELPETRSTLLFRLLGRGRVRRDALRALRLLPDDAWEKRVADKWISQVRCEVRVDGSMTTEDREFVMDVDAWYKEHMAKHEREVEARVLHDVEAQRAEERRQVEAERALAQRQAEVNQLVHLFQRRIGRQLNQDEREALAVWASKHGSTYLADLVLDLSGPEIAAWLEKNGVARSD